MIIDYVLVMINTQYDIRIQNRINKMAKWLTFTKSVQCSGGFNIDFTKKLFCTLKNIRYLSSNAQSFCSFKMFLIMFNIFECIQIFLNMLKQANLYSKIPHLITVKNIWKHSKYIEQAQNLFDQADGLSTRMQQIDSRFYGFNLSWPFNVKKNWCQKKLKKVPKKQSSSMSCFSCVWFFQLLMVHWK